MTDDAARKRKALLLIVGAIAAIGVIGTAIALSVGDDPAGPVEQPAASVDPFSAAGLCRSDQVVTYAVETREATSAFTATAATEQWVGKGEAARTTSVGEDTKLVGVGKPGELPRQVLTVRREQAGWQITSTTACVDALPKDEVCAPEAITVRGREYRRSEDSPEPGVAAYVGNGTLTRCRAEGGRTFASRGAVNPVTAYTANEVPAAEQVVVADGQGVTVFVR